MRDGIILSPRTTQPQVPTAPRLDTALGASLRSAFLPSLSNRDLLSGVPINGSLGTAVVGQFGRGQAFTGVLTASEMVMPGASAYPFVLVWAGRLTAIVTSPAPIYVSINGGAGNAHYIIGGSSTQVVYTTRNNFGTVDQLAVTPPGGSSINVDLLIIAQSLSATDHRIYCNGVMAASTVDSGVPVSAFDRIGLCGTTTANDHHTYFAGFGRRGLMDSYARRATLTSTAFWGELFPPQQRRIWVPAAGAATGTIPLVGRGPGFALAGRGGIAGSRAA